MAFSWTANLTHVITSYKSESYTVGPTTVSDLMQAYLVKTSDRSMSAHCFRTDFTTLTGKAAPDIGWPIGLASPDVVFMVHRNGIVSASGGLEVNLYNLADCITEGAAYSNGATDITGVVAHEPYASVNIPNVSGSDANAKPFQVVPLDEARLLIVDAVDDVRGSWRVHEISLADATVTTHTGLFGTGVNDLLGYCYIMRDGESLLVPVLDFNSPSEGVVVINTTTWTQTTATSLGQNDVIVIQLKDGDVITGSSAFNDAGKIFTSAFASRTTVTGDALYWGTGTICRIYGENAIIATRQGGSGSGSRTPYKVTYAPHATATNSSINLGYVDASNYWCSPIDSTYCVYRNSSTVAIRSLVDGTAHPSIGTWTEVDPSVPSGAAATIGNWGASAAGTGHTGWLTPFILSEHVTLSYSIDAGQFPSIGTPSNVSATVQTITQFTPSWDYTTIINDALDYFLISVQQTNTVDWASGTTTYNPASIEASYTAPPITTAFTNTIYIAVRAVGTDGSTTETGTYGINLNANVATPVLTAGKVGANVESDWSYTYGSDDTLQGFLVYIGGDPTPDWNAAYDNGLAGGDSGSPTEIFSYDVANALVGTIYVAVRAYGEYGKTAESNVVEILAPPVAPTEIRLDGVPDGKPRWASGLIASPVGSLSPVLKLHDVNVPTIDDLVEGSNITLTKVGRTVTIASTGGGGGGGNINGAYDIEAGSYTDLGLSDELESGTLNANWTVVNGTAGTPALLGTQTTNVYSLTTRDKGLMVQSTNTSAQSFSIRAAIIGTDEQLLISVSNAYGAGSYISPTVGFSCTSTTTGWGSNIVSRMYSTYISNVPCVRVWNSASGISNVFYIPDNSARFYYRIIRTGGFIHYLFSTDGTIWVPAAAVADTSVSHVWIFVQSPTFTRISTGDPMTCFNWIRHVAYSGAIDPW